MKLQSGDAALAIGELTASLRFVETAEADHLKQPAPADVYETMARQAWVAGTKKRKEALLRIINHLAGLES